MIREAKRLPWDNGATRRQLGGAEILVTVVPSTPPIVLQRLGKQKGIQVLNRKIIAESLGAKEPQVVQPRPQPL